MQGRIVGLTQRKGLSNPMIEGTNSPCREGKVLHSCPKTRSSKFKREESAFHLKDGRIIAIA